MGRDGVGVGREICFDGGGNARADGRLSDQLQTVFRHHNLTSHMRHCNLYYGTSRN